MRRNEVIMEGRYIPRILIMALLVSVGLALNNSAILQISYANQVELQGAFGGCSDQCNCISHDACGGCYENSTCKGSSLGAHCGDHGDDYWECGDETGEADCEVEGDEPDKGCERCECNGEPGDQARCEMTSEKADDCNPSGLKDDCTPHC